MKRSLCIIPARGGSKRIPNKNIKPFCGKPIIEYSIEAARASGLFDTIMVSTDSKQIAKIAEQAGATIPFYRSENTSNDFATTMDVIVEVIEEYKKQGQEFDFICCLYATSPLVQIEDLKKGFSKLTNSTVNTVMPITQFSFPIWRGLKVSDQKVEMIWPENQNTRSQDLEPAYHDAGQWYWLKPTNIGHQGIYQNASYIILDNQKVQDIDTPEDWELAEIKYQRLNG